MTASFAAPADLAPGQLGQRLAPLRLSDEASLEAMRRSLVQHGQLSAVVVFFTGGGFEIIDGFKRVHGARSLGWTSVRAQVAEVDSTSAKLMIAALHEGHVLTELEEGWLVRSLYRDEEMSQPAIAQRLGRHKSWVCRRLLLVERLDAAVQADVRLGLLTPRSAVALGQLPRGNQHAAAAVVIRGGHTVRQTEHLVTELLACADDQARAQLLSTRAQGAPPVAPAGPRPARPVRSEADWICMDIVTLRSAAARLQARLLAAPLAVFGPAAAQLIADSLRALAPVLVALGHVIAEVTAAERAS